jgi:hypothetical protein
LGHVPTRRGFQSFLGFWGGSEGYFSHSNDFRENETYVKDKYKGQYSTNIFTEQAVAVIEQSKQNPATPWFIYLAYQVS